MNDNYDILKKPINFDNPVESLLHFKNLLKILSPEDFLKFLDNLDSNNIRKLPKRPQKTNMENFIEFLLSFYDDLGLSSHYSSVTNNFFKNVRLSSYFIEYLKKNLIDPEGYIRLSVVEALDLLKGIDHGIKHALKTYPHKLKMTYAASGFSISIPINLTYILNVLLKVFTLEEAIQYLERFHLKALQRRKYMKHENKKVRKIIFDEILNERSFFVNNERFSNSIYGRFIQTHGDHFVDPLIESLSIAFDKHKRYQDPSWMLIALDTSIIMGQKAIDAVINFIIPRNLDEQIQVLKNYLKIVRFDKKIYNIHKIDRSLKIELKPNAILNVQGEVISTVDSENEFIITLRLTNMETLMVKSKLLRVSIGEMIMIKGELIDDEKWGLILIPDREGIQHWNYKKTKFIEEYNEEQFLLIEKQRVKEKEQEMKKNIKFKKEVGEIKINKGKIELQKESEFLRQLEEIDKLIEKKEFREIEDKLIDIIRGAKRYHLNMLENKAKEKYNKYKKFWQK